MNRYSAQKQYWKAKQTKQDKEKISDVVLLQKLQVCVQVCACARRCAPCMCTVCAQVCACVRRCALCVRQHAGPLLSRADGPRGESSGFKTPYAEVGVRCCGGEVGGEVSSSSPLGCMAPWCPLEEGALPQAARPYARARGSVSGGRAGVQLPPAPQLDPTVP